MLDGGIHMNGWQIAIWVFGSLAAGTFLPVLFHMSKGVKPHPGGPSFKDSANFSTTARLKLEQNFDRMRGTLGFWKNQAQKYRAFHVYCLFWIIPATVAVPFLAQAITTDIASKWFLSVVSAHAALLLAFYRGFKIEQNFKAFREGESELYDLQRLM